MMVNIGAKQDVQQLKKSVILVIARQHPGESVGSYVLDGIIRALIQDTSQSEYLRNKFSFMFVPIVNPDGVIMGNYRTSLEGYDINRKWNWSNYESKEFSQISTIKKEVEKILKNQDIDFFLDLHGHSKKQQFEYHLRLNSFIYGCNSEESIQRNCMAKLFPKILDFYSPYFSYQLSKFNIDVQKETTARAIMWKMMKTPNVYTVETSYYGYYDKQKNMFIEFNPNNLTNYGGTIVTAIYHYQIFLNYFEKKVIYSQGFDQMNPFFDKIISEYQDELNKSQNLNKMICEQQVISETESEGIKNIDTIHMNQMIRNNSMINHQTAVQRAKSVELSFQHQKVNDKVSPNQKVKTVTKQDNMRDLRNSVVQINNTKNFLQQFQQA